MIRAVIFDCFGVLYVDSSHYFYERSGVDYPKLERDLHELHRAYDRGWSTFDQYTLGVAELTGLDVAHVRHNIHGKVQRNQTLIDYSQQLRANYKIGLLSNIGSGGMEAFFTAQQRAELFDAVVLSSDVGMAKPDPEIFQLMADRLGVGVEECLMIDDAESNCDGARAAGMQAMMYTETTEAIANLAESLT